MFVYLAWFAEEGVNAARRAAAGMPRVERYLAGHTAPEWTRLGRSGEGWQVVACHAAMNHWRWSFAAADETRTVVAAGLPIGIETDGPLQLGARLLKGEDVHDGVVPPLGLVAVDDDEGRVAVQQDWYGMGQVFVYRSAGVVALSNRPTLLPHLLGDPVRPDLAAWSLYLGNSAFAGDASPVDGVRLLGPGERLVGRRAPDGRWELRSERRRGYDEYVAEGAALHPSFDETAEEVAEGVRRVAASVARHWDGPLRLGLSGGKDSRLIAAALVSAGIVPHFSTNEENPVEGQTARRLTDTVRETRGLDVRHDFYVATEKRRVLSAGLVERAAALQRRNDFMVASTYLNRPLLGAIPAVMQAPSLTGALGECLTDVWLPGEWLRPGAAPTAEDASALLLGKLARILPEDWLTPGARAVLEGFVAEVCGRAAGHGLDPYQVVSYGYLIGRMRRGCTALTGVGQVMPLAIPEVVRAAFRLTPQEKAERRVHNAVIGRLVPEWADVPFVSYRTGMRAADILRVWDGGGQAELVALARRRGPLTDLIRPGVVDDALRRTARGRGGNPEDGRLRQFAMVAVAQQELGVAGQPPARRAGVGGRVADLRHRHPGVGRAARLGRRVLAAARARTAHGGRSRGR